MAEYLLDAPVRYWRCPSCGLLDRTEKPEIHTQMHECPALGGIAIPLSEVKGPDSDLKARHVPVMREDYAGDANPLTAVRTERMDGSNDCVVFPETAAMTVK